jgi:hypothetical protein
MKRGIVLGIFLIVLVFNLSFIIALENETAKKDLAYDCLDKKIQGRCSSMSSEERIFSVLTTGECSNELIADSQNNQCWPKSGCEIKTTAQAILALNEVGMDTSVAQNWLLSKNSTPTDIDWYLEIENTGEISGSYSCSITYSGSSYEVIIGANKKIDSSAGSCLTLSQGDYWLKISPSCYQTEFKISCNEQFLTTLLFMKSGSSTVHVSENVNSASAEGTTTETVNSLCFSNSGSCDYEGSLWAAMVLKSLGKDISSYLAYLITLAEDNQNYLPEAFLHSITDNFREELLNKQDGENDEEYWDTNSGNKFYDTALALLPFQGKSLQEKTNAKEWLLEVQGGEGCWQTSLKDTAFILYSVWPPESSPSPIIINDTCETAGHSCIESGNCSGNLLSHLVCSASSKICCDESGDSQTCEEYQGKNGTICKSSEICSGESTLNVSGLYSKEVCCLTGICETRDESQEDCEVKGYYCMSEPTCITELGGEILDFDCFGGNRKCCSEPLLINTCNDLGGEICNTLNQVCTDGKIANKVSGLDYGQECCIDGGTCEDIEEESECEIANGNCKSSCTDDEEEQNYVCDYSSDVCCTDKNEDGGSLWWVWLLLLLIVLVLLGIIFRDKLRPYWLQIKSKFTKKPKSRPGFPRRPGHRFPILSRPGMRKPMQRKILPPTQRQQPVRKLSLQRPKREIDDVLKKLKEMGN